jgi:hypothetical protein
VNDQIWTPAGSIPSLPELSQRGLYTHYQIPDGAGVSKHITHGAGVNVPDLYLGYYFSGLRSPDWGYLEDYSTQPLASIVVDQMIQVNMTRMGSAEWSIINLNSTTSTSTTQVSPRPGAQLTWIPVGLQGLLVVIGGASQLEDANGTAPVSNADQEFMETVSVYDIDGGLWYNQPTTGAKPPVTAEFCTVVAHENGTQSWQIYAYGGYDGSILSPAYNTMWILSIPSFQWTNVTPAGSEGRYRHVCALPYPDQMLIVGGSGTSDSSGLPGAKIVQFFNVSSLKWQDTYDPKNWSEYKVPEIITNQGDPDQTAGDMDPTLASLFSTPFPVALTTWYPYHTDSRNGKHAWLVPVLAGVLGGLGVVVIAFFIWLFWHKKQGKSRKSASTNPEMSVTAVSGTQDVDPEHPVDRWRLHVKSMASSGVNELWSSDRSSINDLPPDPAELGVPILSYSSPSPQSPELLGSLFPPASPQSGSVEVSADPIRRQEMQELQDSSPRQRPFSRVPSDDDQARLRIRNHPMYPHNLDAMSESEFGGMLGSGQSDLVEAGPGYPAPISPWAASTGPNGPLHTVYGRTDARDIPSLRPLPQQMQKQSHLSHNGYLEFHPGDIYQSPTAREMPIGTLSARNRAFEIEGTDMGANATKEQAHHPGIHQRQTSEESGITLQLPSPGHGLPPSPTPEEDHRRSTVIEAMPEHPSTSLEDDPSATWPRDNQAARRSELRAYAGGNVPSPRPVVRRREVGSPVQSAYQENESRFRREN